MKIISTKNIFISTVLISLLIFNLCIFFVYADDDKPLLNTVIVIDAGHGGSDPGKVSSDGVNEKNINLSIALKLKASLIKKGCSVIMTRETDSLTSGSNASFSKSEDMKKRMLIIEQAKPDYMISIHQNSYPDFSVKGAQVFYYSSSSVSQSLANAIQAHLISEVDTTNTRKAKTGNDYFMLNKSTCPAVIVECGFLSCPVETKKLCNNSYQQKIADAIVNALIDELTHPAQPSSVFPSS